MKPPYFIETLARSGEVLHRQRIENLPIRFGRAYDNDVIIDDAHAGPQHAVAESYSDGHLLLRDLGSRNGTIYQGKRHSTIILGGDTVVRLGHTTLRVRGSDYQVAAELADTTVHSWEGAKPALAGLLLIALMAVLSTWMSDTKAFQPITYLLATAYALGAGLVWAAIWAFGNRLFDRHARLGRHLFILGCGVLAMYVWRLLSAVAAYAWSWEWLSGYGNHAMLAIACCMIFFHLRTIKPHHPRGLVKTCLVLMGLGSSLVLLSNLQSSGRLSDELYMALVLPPAVRQSPDHTSEQFFGDSVKLKEKVDADRAQSVKEGDGPIDAGADDSSEDD